MTRDERSLIEAFQEGDDFAFVSLYNRHKEPVYGFCMKMLLDNAMAQDAMQDTFLRVFENRDRLMHPQAFKSWLFTIARNQCLNQMRRTKRKQRLGEVQMLRVRAKDTPFSELEKSERVALVNAFLEELSPSYREVIILREYQNLSYKEIAAATRSTVSAVKSRLFKARNKLAEYLAPTLERDSHRLENTVGEESARAQSVS